MTPLDGMSRIRGETLKLQPYGSASRVQDIDSGPMSGLSIATYGSARRASSATDNPINDFRASLNSAQIPNELRRDKSGNPVLVSKDDNGNTRYNVFGKDARTHLAQVTVEPDKSTITSYYSGPNMGTAVCKGPDGSTTSVFKFNPNDNPFNT